MCVELTKGMIATLKDAAAKLPSAMVGRKSRALCTYSTTGDSPRQRSRKFQLWYTVHAADGCVCRSQRSGSCVGLLSSVSQQVQSHRTLLGQSREPLERDTAGQCRDGIELGIDDDMERPLPCGSTAGENLRKRSPSRQETVSNSQPTSHARRDSSQILRSHLTQMRFRVKYFARVALVTQQHKDA